MQMNNGCSKATPEVRNQYRSCKSCWFESAAYFLLSFSLLHKTFNEKKTQNIVLLVFISPLSVIIWLIIIDLLIKSCYFFLLRFFRHVDFSSFCLMIIIFFWPFTLPHHSKTFKSIQLSVAQQLKRSSHSNAIVIEYVTKWTILWEQNIETTLHLFT